MDPDYNNAKRLLDAATSVVAIDDSRQTADVRRLVRYWILQEREHRDECVAWLKTFSTFTDFATKTGIVSGTFRQIGATYSEEDGECRIIQQLEAEINTSAAITSGSSRWRFRAGTNYQSGSAMVVLELPFCDPLQVRTMAAANSLRVYTDSIYTKDDVLLSGKWYSVRQEPTINPETGFGTINWFLSRYYNTDLIFSHRAGDDAFVVDFFKLHIAPDAIAEFGTTYYFDAAGNYYVSSDGTSYTNKNGATVSPALTFAAGGIEAHTLLENVAGRRVVQDVSPDPATGESTIHVRIEFRESQSYEGTGGNPIVVFGEATEKIRFMGSYVGLDLPSNEQLLGIEAAGGRSKTVTRISNPRIEGGLFNYDLYEYEYTAPMNTDDDWFFAGSASTMERERRSLFNMITDQAGYSGWEPIDIALGAYPRANTIEMAIMTPRNILRERKYFVRNPTDDDIMAAGIVSSMDDFDAKAVDARTTIVHEIGGGGNLFYVERVKTTIDYDLTAVDVDGFSRVELARLRRSDLVTWAVPAPGSVAATALGGSSIRISWGSGSDATAYQVKRSAVSGGPYQAIYYGLPSGSLQFDDTGLAAGSTYYYVVVAVREGFTSLNSVEASATTTGGV